ncbi:CTP-dependent diacylglycerol kinase 1 [Choanephora cucurbitarum]|uniref:CTP-dependent diacylglycerol kinase 1 n=1 Tax=Choanephora cucurbitarum TaxID=101091 RepID=A0A1C7NRJ0_9FUNG|nr:CTP-dependent diacylglycerol kinase 1 [Choanephora cucurbitarum]
MTSTVQKKDTLLSLVPEKGSWEIPRKLFHYSIGFIVLYLFIDQREARDVYPFLSAFLAFVVSLEILRFNLDWFNRLYCSAVGIFMRPTEVQSRFNGVVYYLLGCIIVLYWFPLDIAALSIIYLSWTDPTASICGRLYGKYTWQYNGKSLAGTLGAVITGTLVTYAFYGPLVSYHQQLLSYHVGSWPLLSVSLYGGLVAGFSEGISNLFGLDDNLTIPVLSAILLLIPTQIKLN